MDPKDCHILFGQKYIPKDSRPYFWSSMLLFSLVAVLIGNHQPVDVLRVRLPIHPVFRYWGQSVKLTSYIYLYIYVCIVMYIPL